MKWGRSESRCASSRARRPQLRKLTPIQREGVLRELEAGIQRSPVLSAFDVQVRVVRGRFCLDWRWNPSDAEDRREVHGRLTPLEASEDYLLEVEHRAGRWSEYETGSLTKLIRAVAGDRLGTFHGVGSLDRSLRRATKLGVERLRVKKSGKGKFVFSDTGRACTVQDALFHYFGVPIHVVAKPAAWYARHRKPCIVECSVDRTRVLVSFTASNMYGEEFGGSCLYLLRGEEWEAYTIRPNRSNDIRSAEAWLIKRRWEQW